MAQEYADEHRLIRYRGGQARDITAFAGNLQAVDELNALSVELSFDVITAPWDGYVEKNLVTPGDKLRLVNHDRTVFAGQVERVGLDGSAIAYDRGWYLNKSTIILQASGIAADEAIRRAWAWPRCAACLPKSHRSGRATRPRTSSARYWRRARPRPAGSTSILCRTRG